MKNLKRTLSLVLAIALVFSLGATAFATDFTDDEDITYTEAVEVMTELGIINGMDDGSFDPQGEFTREQAAKIIAYMLLGEDTAEILSTSSDPFDDVAADRWSAGYISYCVAQGIIAGYGDGTFGPSDSLTKYAWLKMLLVAVGYDADENGLTGDNWEINTTSLALSEGLVNSTELGYDFDREAAVYYAFAAMQFDPDGETVYVVGSYKFDSLIEAYIYADGEISDISQETDNAGSLLSTVYGIDPVSTFDDAGRPITVYDDDDEISFVITADPVLTYTTKVTGKALYTALGLDETTDVTVTVNSMDDQETETSSIVKGDTSTKFGGTAITTEVYNIKGTIYIVEFAPELVEVTGVKTVSETSSHGQYVRYVVGGVSYYDYITVVDDEDEGVNKAVVSSDDIEADDYVLAYVLTDDDGVDTIYISTVDIISGYVTSIADSSATVTIDDEDYTAVSDLLDDIDVDDDTLQYFYVDENGYIVGLAETTSSDEDEYVAVIRAYQSLEIEGNTGTYYNYATVVYDDGSVEDVKISSASYDLVEGVGYAEDDESEAVTAGGVFTYTVNTKGLYVLTEADIDSFSSITKASTTLDGTVKASSSTIYVFVEYDDDDDDIEYATGDVTIVKGYKNVSTYSSVEAYAVDTNDSGYANVVYVLYNGGATKTVTELTYVIGLNSRTTSGYVWDVIVDGEVTTVTTAYKVLSAGYIYGSYTTTGSTVATPLDLTVVEDIDDDEGTGGIYVNDGDFLVINDEVVLNADGDEYEEIDEDVPVYIIDTEDVTVTTIEISDIASGVDASNYGFDIMEVYVLSDSDDEEITAVYILLSDED